MPELPEVETVRRGLAPLLVGRRLQFVGASGKPLRWPVDVDAVRAACAHARVLGLRRRGKYLLVDLTALSRARLEGGAPLGVHVTSTPTNDAGAAGPAKSVTHVLMVHLGMTGWLGVVDAGEPAARHEHVRWDLSDGRQLRFVDARRFGAVGTHAPADEANHPLLRHLGPEPLGGDGFDGASLWRRARGVRRSIKGLLMDATCVVGVGNIYANEALFVAGIDPRMAAMRLSRARAERLVRAVRAVLTDAIELGGTTLRDFRSAEGVKGLFAPRLRIYGKGGSACGVCAGPVVKWVLEGRATYLCRTCQVR